MITGFKGATGTAGIVFLLLATIVWLALPFGHPVYAVVIPPLIVAGIVYAFMRGPSATSPELEGRGLSSPHVHAPESLGGANVPRFFATGGELPCARVRAAQQPLQGRPRSQDRPQCRGPSAHAPLPSNRMQLALRGCAGTR